MGGKLKALNAAITSPTKMTPDKLWKIWQYLPGLFKLTYFCEERQDAIVVDLFRVEVTKSWLRLTRVGLTHENWFVLSVIEDDRNR